MRCEDILQDADNALRKQVVKPFALGAPRVVIDYNEMDVVMPFEEVHRNDDTGVKKPSMVLLALVDRLYK